MKECAVNRERAVIANHQMPEVAEPREGALDWSSDVCSSDLSSVLGHRFASIPAMRGDQLDPALSQPLSQRVTVVTTIGDQAERFLSRPHGMGSAAYADRRERRFCELRFVRGCRTKVLSQRKTLAVDHHHPLRALAPLGFSDSSAPFLAGAKLPSRKDALHCSCFRSLSSARNARQILSQTPCSSQSRSLRQHVAGEGELFGQILPASAAAQNPQKAFEHLAVGGPWPSAASSRTWTRKQGPDLLPLGVGQQTTVSRHRPSSGAADLVYLAFPSTQLPQNSGLAPSFETASRHIKYYFTFPVCALERSRWRDGRFACYAPYVMLQGRAFNCDFRFPLIFLSQAKSIGCKRKKIQSP